MYLCIQASMHSRIDACACVCICVFMQVYMRVLFVSNELAPVPILRRSPWLRSRGSPELSFEFPEPRCLQQNSLTRNIGKAKCHKAKCGKAEGGEANVSKATVAEATFAKATCAKV